MPGSKCIRLELIARGEIVTGFGSRWSKLRYVRLALRKIDCTQENRLQLKMKIGNGESAKPDPAPLDGVVTFFAGANTYGFRQFRYKNLAVAHLARSSLVNDCIHDLVQSFVVADNLDLDFGYKIDRVFRASVHFGVTFLSAVTFDLRDRHAYYPNFIQGGLNVFQLEMTNYRFDFFHRDPRWPMQPKADAGPIRKTPRSIILREAIRHGEKTNGTTKLQVPRTVGFSS